MNIKSALIGALIAAVCLVGLGLTIFDAYARLIVGGLFSAIGGAQ